MVTITALKNVDRTAIENDPHVRNLLIGPWDICLYEFYDPLYDQLHDSDPHRSSAARSVQGTKEQIRELWNRERMLLAPLFRNAADTARYVQFSVPTFTAMYKFLAKERCEWPELQVTPHWEEKQQLGLALRCTLLDKEIQHNLQAIVEEWKDWLGSEGLMEDFETVSPTKDEVKFGIRLSSASGDRLAVLFRRLADTRSITSLDRISIQPLA